MSLGIINLKLGFTALRKHQFKDRMLKSQRVIEFNICEIDFIPVAMNFGKQM